MRTLQFRPREWIYLLRDDPPLLGDRTLFYGSAYISDLETFHRGEQVPRERLAVVASSQRLAEGSTLEDIAEVETFITTSKGIRIRMGLAGPIVTLLQAYLRAAPEGAINPTYVSACTMDIRKEHPNLIGQKDTLTFSIGVSPVQHRILFLATKATFAIDGTVVERIQ